MGNQLSVSISVNGKIVEALVSPQESLLDFLRHRAGATEVKCGCAQGDCGTCSVIFQDRAVKSCLVFAAQADGEKVITIKGLQGDPLMNKLEEAFVMKGAVQCGFCTPGMLISAWSLLKENPRPSLDEIREGIGGNLCRCTGYKKIVEAIGEASLTLQAREEPPSRPSGEARASYLLLGGG